MQLRLRVEGAEAGDSLRNATVHAARPDADTVQTTLEPCGPGCFAGETTLPGQGRWTLNATVDSRRHPIDVTVGIPLPAQDGSRVLARSVAATKKARTARVDETLTASEGGQPVTSRYAFAAPDRMRWDVTSGGSTRIAIGDTGYLKRSPEESFESYAWPGDGFTWPAGFYDSFFQGRAAVRILGSETLDGADTTVLSFVQPGYPAWYLVSVDDQTGRIRRLDMRAKGHIMDQTYRAYDEPVTITPPPTAQPQA